MLQVQWWQERLYPNPESRDAVARFLHQVEACIGPESTVLDIGAGAGERNGYSFRGRCLEMIGVDLDPRVETNPLLDRGLVGDGVTIPLPDHSADVAFSVYVLEHVADPDRFAGEVARVLRPGGRFFALTPNRAHYVPLFASATPHGFHRWFNAKRGRPEEDTFPTYYRLNSRPALEAAFGGAGLVADWIRGLEVQPNYLTFSVPTFLAGAAYERAVNSTDLLAPLRVNWMACFRKPRLVVEGGVLRTA